MVDCSVCLVQKYETETIASQKRILPHCRFCADFSHRFVLLTSLSKHTMKDTETRARKITVVKKGDESEGM